MYSYKRSWRAPDSSRPCAQADLNVFRIENPASSRIVVARDASTRFLKQEEKDEADRKADLVKDPSGYPREV